MKNVSNKMTNLTKHPKPADMLERKEFDRVSWRCLRMMTTESLNSASSRGGVLVFSVAHERETHPLIHVERERIVRTTPRLQPTRQWVGSLSQGHPGLCDTPVGPGRTPTVHGGSCAGRPWVAHSNSTTRRPTHDNTTKTRS